MTPTEPLILQMHDRSSRKLAESLFKDSPGLNVCCVKELGRQAHALPSDMAPLAHWYRLSFHRSAASGVMRAGSLGWRGSPAPALSFSARPRKSSPRKQGADEGLADS